MTPTDITVVRYRVHPGQGERNEELVRDVYTALSAAAPPDFRYATLVLEDGVSFVHVAARHGADATPLTGLDAFGRFQADLGERAEERPEVRQARLVGAYGF